MFKKKEMKLWKGVLFTNGRGVIRLDYSDMKYPPAPDLVRLLGQELGRLGEYPSGDYGKIKQKYAEYAGVKPGQVLVSNGLDEAIDLVTRAWGRNVLIPSPTFSQFELAARRRNARVFLADCFNDGEYALRFPKERLRKASLAWICSPNNPTGTTIPRGDILRAVEGCAGMVCVDEAYYEYSGQTVADLISDRSNLVVLRGLSKGFGLAGLRIGFALSDEKNIKRLESMRQIFSVNRLAERAAEEVLGYGGYYSGIRRRIADTRERFADGLRRIGLRPFKSAANFILVEFGSLKEARAAYEGLKKAGIVALPAWDGEFSGLNGPFIRFTIGTEEQMGIVADEIEKLTEDWKRNKKRM
jgi:histidinol-phosphate aminotransferase